MVEKLGLILSTPVSTPRSDSPSGIRVQPPMITFQSCKCPLMHFSTSWGTKCSLPTTSFVSANVFLRSKNEQCHTCICIYTGST
jgi:hypothetical protein